MVIDLVCLILAWLITVRLMCAPKRTEYRCRRAKVRGSVQTANKEVD